MMCDFTKISLISRYCHGDKIDKLGRLYSISICTMTISHSFPVISTSSWHCNSRACYSEALVSETSSVVDNEWEDGCLISEEKDDPIRGGIEKWGIVKL
jgi:hypothetical protein